MTMMTEFERRAAVASGAIRADFGEGWMTTGARDMIRIAAFAGFDVPQLVKRVAMATKHDGMTGPRLVDRIMGEMWDDALRPEDTMNAQNPICGICYDGLCEDHVRDCAFRNLPIPCECPRAAVVVASLS